MAIIYELSFSDRACAYHEKTVYRKKMLELGGTEIPSRAYEAFYSTMKNQDAVKTLRDQVREDQVRYRKQDCLVMLYFSYSEVDSEELKGDPAEISDWFSTY